MQTLRVAFSIALLLIGAVVIVPAATAQDLSPPLDKMSTILGRTVESREGIGVGDIEDVIMQADTGDLVYAVLASDGLLGLGEKRLAIPWRALQPPTAARTFRLRMRAEKLQRAPSFDNDKWPDMEDRHWGDTIHAYYGQPSYWGQHLPAKTARETAGHRQREPVGQSLLRASHVLKSEVLDADDQRLGDVKDVVIDTAAAKVHYVALSVGNVFGLSEKLFALPWRALQQSAGLGTFRLDVDKKTLQEASGFDKDHWPNQPNARWGS